MTRTELSQIFWLNQELKMWEDKLRNLRDKAYPKTVKNDSDGIRASGVSDKTGKLAAEIADTSQVVEGILARIQIQIRRTYEYIDTIEDSQLRQIVQYRCVDCMSWDEVGCAVGITDEAAKKIFYRAYP